MLILDLEFKNESVADIEQRSREYLNQACFQRHSLEQQYNQTEYIDSAGRYKTNRSCMDLASYRHNQDRKQNNGCRNTEIIYKYIPVELRGKGNDHSYYKCPLPQFHIHLNCIHS